jgi:uncharacterized membrane protein
MASKPLTLALAATLVTSLVSAQSFQVLGPISATDVNADGAVVVGFGDGGEVFRWTEATGLVMLGRAVPQFAGTPGVSDDGMRIGATIADEGLAFTTQGVWTDGAGWRQLEPFPPDSGLLDGALGSAWDISGDGTTTVGLYWRPGASGGLAHASAGTDAGVADLGSSGSSSRASTINRDGSVIGGFDEHETGFRRAAIWTDAGLTVLPPDDPGEVLGLSADGAVAVGQVTDPATGLPSAAAWRHDGADWNLEIFGALPGTAAPFGQAGMNAASADGAIIVGYNAFDFGPFAAISGIVWTSAGGFQQIEDFMTDRGIAPPSDFNIRHLVGISADGSTIVGAGQPAGTFRTESFILRLDSACYADCDQSGDLDFFDFLCFQNQFGAGCP